jgi:hypothetical protein
MNPAEARAFKESLLDHLEEMGKRGVLQYASDDEARAARAKGK